MAKKEKNRKNVQKWLVDTSAAISFSLAVGTTNDLAIVGLTPKQCLESRAITICNNLVLGRPYGWYRDKVCNILNCDRDSSHLKRVLANTASFASFWAPIYAGVLYATGADNDQIYTGYISATTMSTFIGVPYGYYLDGVRRLFKTNEKGRRINGQEKSNNH